MAGYLTVWHSHCTRARFTVLVSSVMSLQFIHAGFPAHLPADAGCETCERIVLRLGCIA